MKKVNLIYWIFTGLLCVLMLFSAIPNLMTNAASIEMISKHLGYPQYIIAFLGLAKLLAVIVILIPGFPRLKEWAYAGLVFDLGGALYSFIAVGDPVSGWLPMLIGFAIIGLSYTYFHKRLALKQNAGKFQ